MQKQKYLLRSSSSSSSDQEEYEVEEIIDKKIKNGVTKYKVKWKGYPVSDCSKNKIMFYFYY